jgi:ribosomal protein S18 acetylase RimI-like enzyme
MSETADITLRPATATDREVLLAIFAASRSIELSMVPWDDERKQLFVAQQLDAQTAYYREKYPDATHDIIELEGKPVGRIYADRRPDEIAILDVAVLNECSRKGIGSTVIRRLQTEAAATRRSIGVLVEVYNPSQEFFIGLGFAAVSEDGMNRRFEWRAA